MQTDAGYTKLSDIRGIATATFGTSTFALVTDQSDSDGGIQVIDISNPYAPSPASAINDGEDNYTHLSGGSRHRYCNTGWADLCFGSGRVNSFHYGVQIIKLDYSTLISLTSNNTNPAYAKAGDTLELEFSATDTINSCGIVKILGLYPGSSFSGETFSMLGSVPSSVEIESNMQTL